MQLADDALQELAFEVRIDANDVEIISSNSNA